VISPTEAKAYVNALLALISADRGALLLLGHVDKQTAKNPTTAEGYGGTAAWHNAVRARWYLHPETREGDDGGAQEKTGALLMELQKNNHGRDGDVIRLAWDEDAHLLVGRTNGTGFANLDRITQERDELDGIMAALRACTARGYVPAATSGRRTAFHVLQAAEEFPASLRAGKPACPAARERGHCGQCHGGYRGSRTRTDRVGLALAERGDGGGGSNFEMGGRSGPRSFPTRGLRRASP
jgi:hypothetical protein